MYTNVIRRMSDHGISYLMEREAVELHLYYYMGIPHIGVGHVLTTTELATGALSIDGALVSYADGLTRVLVMALLQIDLGKYETVVAHAVTTRLTDDEFDALVSLAFNIGVGGFVHSTLVELLNAGNYDAVPDQMRRWNKDGEDHHVDPGLVARREWDVRLWLGQI